MKKLTFILAFLLLPMALFAERLPVALLFPVIPDKATSPDFASEMTQAIKLYLRQTGRADVTDFDLESPIVLRAVREHQIDSSELVAVMTPDARLKMASKLNTDLAVSGEIAIKAGQVTVSVWLAPVNAKKICRLDCTVEIGESTDRQRATSNAIQSATSSVVGRIAAEVLKDIKPNENLNQPPIADNFTSVPGIDADPITGDAPAEGAGTHLGKADGYLKLGDEASAIVEYRKAINDDPKDIEVRLKLVKLYGKRKLYTEAISELERARLIDPQNEDLRAELVRIYEEEGSSDKAAQIYISEADQHPKDVAARLKAGDHYWGHGKIDQAMQQYVIAEQIDMKNPAPHEKLALALATQSLYNLGRDELLQLQKCDACKDPAAVAHRYGQLCAVVDPEINMLAGQLETAAAGLENKAITREVRYDNVRGLGVVIDSISGFLNALIPPVSEASNHRRRVLGCSLMSQSCSSMLAFLETNKGSDQDDATIFLSEAKKQLTGQ